MLYRYLSTEDQQNVCKILYRQFDEKDAREIIRQISEYDKSEVNIPLVGGVRICDPDTVTYDKDGNEHRTLLVSWHSESGRKIQRWKNAFKGFTDGFNKPVK